MAFSSPELRIVLEVLGHGHETDAGFLDVVGGDLVLELVGLLISCGEVGVGGGTSSGSTRRLL
jgi:hypothetical protein